MYYVLCENIGMCGYKGLPFGLVDFDGINTRFFSKEEYEVILMLDGETDIDKDSLTEKQTMLLEFLVKEKVAKEVAEKTPLEERQIYHKYPVVYKLSAHWSITGACNYKCKHCFMSAPDCKYVNPSREDCMNVLAQLDECGIRGVTITGGEPLVSPWFYDILDECIKRNIKVTGILTNGALVTESLINEIKKRGMNPGFQLSFDGIGWHDWIRGIDGAEEKAINAFKLLKDNNIRTNASMCLHKHNLETVNESLRLLDSLGVEHVKVCPALPAGLWQNETEHFLSNEEIYEYMYKKAIPEYFKDNLNIAVQFASLIDHNPITKKTTIPPFKFSGRETVLEQNACGVVKRSVYISPEGIVLPCMSMLGYELEEPFDSLFDVPLKEILTESKYINYCNCIVKDIVEKHEECVSCEYRLICGGGCRACVDESNVVDYYGKDKIACSFFKDGWFDISKELIKKIKSGNL